MNPTRWRLLRSLGRNALLYRFCRLTGRAAPIQAISLEVTHHCMGRCVMCNIWKIPSSFKDLPLGDWLGLLASPTLAGLREIDITGGEPFLRKDLQEMVESIAGLKRNHLTCLRGVAITTNGFLTKRILAMTEKMAARMESENLDLVFACAMDAVGEVHDQVRRVKNGWKKLDATIRGLCEIRTRHRNLIVGLKTTVLPRTLGQLHSVADYADSKGLFTIVSPCIFTENRYDNIELRDELDSTPEDLSRLAAFFEDERFRWTYHRKVLSDYLRRGYVSKPCTAGFNYFFVRSTGEVFPCPLINLSLGNCREMPLEKLLRSTQARSFRRRIGSYEQCRTCTEPGLERYALPFEGLTYARLMLQMGFEDFAKFHHHMGLNKYFG